MENIIEVKNLKKKYKTQNQYAVNDISFSIPEGEIVGVLGPNGAGKSTLIKMLLGVIRPSSGEIAVLGKDPLHFGNRDKLGIGVYLGGKTNLIYHLPVIDSVRLFGSMYKVSKMRFQENLTYYSAKLQCESFLNQRVATLSLGQRLRAELLCILIYEPRLLVLDEPTLGLDIEGKRQIRDMLHTLAEERGISVLITTHDVNDMQKLCNRILMICHGEKAMDVTSRDFERLLTQRDILLTDADLEPMPEGVQFVEQDNNVNRYLVPADQTEAVKALIQTLSYRELKQETPNLEDILYEYYR